MLKKSLLLFFCFIVLLASGCQKTGDPLSADQPSEPQSSLEPAPEPEPALFQNPLTGLLDLAEEKTDDRPVAIAINNISVAQPVQAGIGKADIVYETEVEGGITRLLALYQDVGKVEKIGTIRSARYVFVDLALGHNALYIHHGQDPVYCKPHLNDIDDVTLSENNYGFRLKNGLAREHTLYTNGEKLWSGLVSSGRKTENTKTGTWVTFGDQEASSSFENTASSVTVPFSSSYRSVFRYDAATGKYTRYFKDTLRKDYFTGETTQVKNVFVLLTSIQNYPDGYHRQVSLQSGSGYYCVNGTYTPISWSKGSAKSSFRFTTADGKDLVVDPGNSWVCLANRNNSKPIFE